MSKRAILLFAFAIPVGILLGLTLILSSGPIQDLPTARADDAGPVITVTTDSDINGVCPSSDSCSLRTAIMEANDDPTGSITITFADNYTITLDSALPNLARDGATTVIQGDRGTGAPSTVIDASALTPASGGGLYSGLRVTGEHWRIQGVVIMGDDGDNFGVTIRGNYNELRDSYIGLDASGTLTRPNNTGILVTAGAHHNLIENNLIAGNAGHGLSLYSTADGTITPSHHNTVTHNYIGTNPAGDDLGNEKKGIIIQRGSHDNYIFDNRIAHNSSFGVYLYGGTEAAHPPTGNFIISNTLTMNNTGFPKRGAVVSDGTHRAISNTVPSASGGFDNVISSNLITGNLSAGIYNVGASPLISGNHVLNNLGYGIYNITHFGDSEHPDGYQDDILSIPYIANNEIDGNSGVGILSLDTAPARRYELATTLDNDIGSNGSRDVIQSWYAGVEVLTGTVTNQVPITSDAGVRIYKGDQSDAYELGYNDEVSDTVMWSDDYGDTYGDATSWSRVREFVVDLTGTFDSWLTHTVEVDLGTMTGTVVYPFDGLSATKPLSDFVGLPNYRVTGPFARYQIAEVNFAYDSDSDTIPDVIEGGGTDTDGDGTPDYQDGDADGDGIPDEDEGQEDTDGDGTPDWQDPDDDGDGIPTEDEDPNGDDDPTNDDFDGDGTPDYLDDDDDGDGIPTEDEDSDGDGDPTNDDADGDGIPDYLEHNKDDPDGDDKPNYEDTDSDDDGISDDDEYYYGGGDDDPLAQNCNVDTDGDGVPNCRDNDVDGDGIPNHLDGDSDGDGIRDEDEGTGDTDSDGVPDWLDPEDGADTSQGGDSDGDGTPDTEEGTGDSDGDGVSDYLDPTQCIYLPLVIRSSAG